MVDGQDELIDRDELLAAAYGVIRRGLRQRRETVDDDRLVEMVAAEAWKAQVELRDLWIENAADWFYAKYGKRLAVALRRALHLMWSVDVCYASQTLRGDWSDEDDEDKAQVTAYLLAVHRWYAIESVDASVAWVDVDEVARWMKAKGRRGLVLLADTQIDVSGAQMALF